MAEQGSSAGAVARSGQASSSGPPTHADYRSFDVATLQREHENTRQARNQHLRTKPKGGTKVKDWNKEDQRLLKQQGDIELALKYHENEQAGQAAGLEHGVPKDKNTAQNLFLIHADRKAKEKAEREGTPTDEKSIRKARLGWLKAWKDSGAEEPSENDPQEVKDMPHEHMALLMRAMHHINHHFGPQEEPSKSK
ncbi:MAG: hypothetical protein Q9162_003452 [Coniocarpon cinnabarinum]